MQLILASTSPYRRALLERLQLPFQCVAPEVDESPQPGETAAQLAQRLASAKAEAVSRRFPDALVIGSDQVACLDGRLLGKPGGHERAREQLRASSGRTVEFFTGVALARQEPAFRAAQTVPFQVHFRTLSDAEIEHYLARETPWDCAGSFKCEGLGIALFERLAGDDPTSLEGLPLIALCHLLKRAGHPVLE